MEFWTNLFWLGLQNLVLLAILIVEVGIVAFLFGKAFGFILDIVDDVK